MPFARPLPEVSHPLLQQPQGLVVQQHEVSKRRSDHSGGTINPLAHLVHHIPGTPSPSEQAHDRCAKDYAHDDHFLEFLQMAQMVILLRTEAEARYNQSGGDVIPHVVPGTEGFTLSGRTYVTDPKCKDMVFGYPTDLYKGKIPEEAGNDPYRYYEIYLEKAKNDPEYILSGVGKLTVKGPNEPRTVTESYATEEQLRKALDEVNRKLFNLVRRFLGADAASDAYSKKINDEEKRREFLTEAYDLGTKEQVERLFIRKYQKPASQEPPGQRSRIGT